MMEGPEKNKMMNPKDVSKKAGPILEEFFFPEYQKTITASSREEAEKKLKELIKEK